MLRLASVAHCDKLGKIMRRRQDHPNHTPLTRPIPFLPRAIHHAALVTDGDEGFRGEVELGKAGGWREYRSVAERDRDCSVESKNLLTELGGHVDAWARCE